MWLTYTYEIAISTREGGWQRLHHGEDAFSRTPEEIARSLLERWINDNRGGLPGGQVIVCRRKLDVDPAWLEATVRVRVFRGTLTGLQKCPEAAAYLGRSRKNTQAGPLAKLLRRRRNTAA